MRTSTVRTQSPSPQSSGTTQIARFTYPARRNYGKDIARQLVRCSTGQPVKRGTMDLLLIIIILLLLFGGGFGYRRYGYGGGIGIGGVLLIVLILYLLLGYGRI